MNTTNPAPPSPHDEIQRLIVGPETAYWAGAEVVRRDGVVHVCFHVSGGHIPRDARRQLIDLVLDLPEIAAEHELHATVPLGDTELIEGLRAHCHNLQTRAAGATCLLDGDFDESS